MKHRAVTSFPTGIVMPHLVIKVCNNDDAGSIADDVLFCLICSFSTSPLQHTHRHEAKRDRRCEQGREQAGKGKRLQRKGNISKSHDGEQKKRERGNE